MDIADIKPSHPVAIIPVMRVTKAAIARDIKILSSSASFILSNRLGNYGRGFLFIPKNFVLLWISFLSPIMPVSASVAKLFITPLAYP
jgi:hypothetical protein